MFLDRDGVINVNRHDHVKSWGEFEFLPGVAAAICRLSVEGCRVFVFSNQAIVGRGTVSVADVDRINELMTGALSRHGAHIEAVAYCPHRPEESCSCRKPEPGLLLGLAAEFGVNLNRSVVIGDALSDIRAGQSAGCRTILVQTGRGKEQLELARVCGHYGFAVARDLGAAVDLVLGSDTDRHTPMEKAREG